MTKDVLEVGFTEADGSEYSCGCSGWGCLLAVVGLIILAWALLA